MGLLEVEKYISDSLAKDDQYPERLLLRELIQKGERLEDIVNTLAEFQNFYFLAIDLDCESNHSLEEKVGLLYNAGATYSEIVTGFKDEQGRNSVYGLASALKNLGASYSQIINAFSNVASFVFTTEYYSDDDGRRITYIDVSLALRDLGATPSEIMTAFNQNYGRPRTGFQICYGLSIDYLDTILDYLEVDNKERIELLAKSGLTKPKAYRFLSKRKHIDFSNMMNAEDRRLRIIT